MSRKFIAAIAATAVAVSMIGATPSFAGSRGDRDKALLGLGALILLGAVIADSQKDRRQRADVVIHPQPVKPRPLPQRVKKKMLPGECLRTVKTRGHVTRFLGYRCLQNNYRWTAQLPQDCAVKLRTDRGKRFGYAPRCLRQYGYRLNG